MTTYYIYYYLEKGGQPCHGYSISCFVLLNKMISMDEWNPFDNITFLS
jgi:hypothetical protein